VPAEAGEKRVVLAIGFIFKCTARGTQHDWAFSGEAMAGRWSALACGGDHFFDDASSSGRPTRMGTQVTDCGEATDVPRGIRI